MIDINDIKDVHMTNSILFSIIYFCMFSIYMSLSIYVLMLNYKGILNRLFFFILLLLSIWAFAFSITTSASDYYMALTWRKVASLGWGVIYSALLHFIIYLTNYEQKNTTYKLSKPLTVLIYLPAVINVLIFGLISSIADYEYRLVKTDFGWMNLSANTLADSYFNYYYFTYLLLTMFLLIRWGVKAKQSPNRRVAILLITSFAFASIIGSITDIIIISLFDTPLLQLGIILIFIPIASILVATQKYRFMASDPIWTKSNPHDILTTKTKMNISKYLSILLILGCYLSFIYQYFLYGDPLVNTALYCSGLLLMSISLYLSPYLRWKERYSDLFIISILSLSIPYVLLKYETIDAAVTIWTLPFFIIVFTILFLRKSAIIISSLVSILTLMVIWIKNPIREVTLYGEEHLLRIIIIIVFSWFSYYIRSLYTKRLEETEQQFNYQQALASISSDILMINKDNTREVFAKALASLTHFSGYDRVYILTEQEDSQTYEVEWCLPAIDSTRESHRYISIAPFNWLKSRIKDEGYLIIKDKKDIPSEAVSELKFMTTQKANSSIFMPIKVSSKSFGILGMDLINTYKEPSSNELKQYRVLINILSDGFHKAQAEIEIHNHANRCSKSTTIYGNVFTHQKHFIIINHFISQCLSDSISIRYNFFITHSHLPIPRRHL